MMTKLRKNMTIIFVIVIVAFVLLMFFQWGMDISSSNSPERGDYVGKINNTKISSNYLNSVYLDMRKAYLASSNKSNIDARTEKMLLDQAFDKIVSDIMFADIQKKYGYTSTEDEIKSIVLNVPPQELRSDQRFYKEDGTFDFDLYRQMISDPQNREFYISYYMQIKDQLPKVKIQTDLLSGIKVQNDEVGRALRFAESKFQIEYVVVPTVIQSPITVSEEEAKSYFENNRYQFVRNPEAVISLVAIPKTPSSQDVLSSKENIDGLRADIAEGNISFEKAAELYSEDYGSGAQGGSLGWFKRGMMVKEFNDAVFAMKKNEVSAPVRTQFGWHIIRCEDVRQDSVKASHILISITPSMETVEATKKNAENIQRKMKDNGFENSAKEESLEIITTMPFNPEKNQIAELGSNAPKLIDFASSAKINDISSVVELPDFFVIARLDAKEEGGMPDYEEAKELVKSTIISKKRKILSAVNLSNLVQKIETEKSSLQGFAAKNKLRYYKTGLVTAKERLSEVEPNSPLFGAVFGAEQNRNFYVTGENTGYIFRVLKTEEISQENVQKLFETYYQTIMQSKQQAIAADWMRNLKSKYTVKDYR
ncbi:MAG: peptidylprolyl isomerase [bacterium]|nr:peptidylprolyl isomerase [bacterium]